MADMSDVKNDILLVRLERDRAKLAEERGDHLSREIVDAVLEAALGIVRAQLLDMPQRLSTEVAALAGVSDVRAVRELLRAEVWSTLEAMTEKLGEL